MGPLAPTIGPIWPVIRSASPRTGPVLPVIGPVSPGIGPVSPRFVFFFASCSVGFAFLLRFLLCWFCSSSAALFLPLFCVARVFCFGSYSAPLCLSLCVASHRFISKLRARFALPSLLRKVTVRKRARGKGVCVLDITHGCSRMASRGKGGGEAPRCPLADDFLEILN